MIKMKMEFDDSKLRKNSTELEKRINRNIAAAVDYDAAWGQGYMRQNAPWTDRTGAARSGLMAVPFSHGSVHEILLAYSVYYGIWLEIANNGRYQILIPAMRVIGNKIIGDLKRMVYE